MLCFSTLSALVLSNVFIFVMQNGVDMKQKGVRNLEDFYGEYFSSFSAEESNHDERFEEYLDHTEETDDSKEEDTAEKEKQPPYDLVDSGEEDSISTDWNDVLSQCTQGYQEEEIARNSVVRSVHNDDKLSLKEYNTRKIEVLCDKHDLPDGVYYLFEIYGDRKNINRGLHKVDCMISNSEFSDEEILLLFEVAMLWYQLPYRHLSWNKLAMLLEVSHGIPSVEEFMTTLTIVMERQAYNQFLDTDQLIRNFSDLINTNMFF